MTSLSSWTFKLLIFSKTEKHTFAFSNLEMVYMLWYVLVNPPFSLLG